MTDKEIAEKKKELQERRKYLAEALAKVKYDYSQKNYGEHLQIIGPILSALSTATAAQVIKSGSPSLLIGLRIALQGIESEKCKGGVIGKTLSMATNGVVDLVQESFLSNEDVGSRDFFKLLSQTLLLATVSVAWKLEQINLTLGTEVKDEIEEQRKKVFGFELMLLLILKVSVVELVIKNIALICGVKEERQMTVVKLMKALMLILAILTAAKGNELTLKMLVLDLKDYLIEGLEDIQKFINEAAEAEKTGEGAASLSIFIPQAIASLENEDFDTLKQTYESILEIFQSNPAKVAEEFKQITEFAEVLSNGFLQGSMEQLNRTTTSLMI